MLEVYIPSFSVCALLGVTGWIVSDAIAVIESGGGGDSVDVVVMFAFAAANFVVDVASFYMFWARGRDILVTDLLPVHVQDPDTEEGEWDFSSMERADQEEGEKEEEESAATARLSTKANLNMISALTHVGSDTLRTVAVFLAALIATVSLAPSSLCDAWAALAVSITIVFAVIPLIGAIYQAAMQEMRGSAEK